MTPDTRTALSRAMNHLAQARDALRHDTVDAVVMLRTQIEMALDQASRLLRDLDAGRRI